MQPIFGQRIMENLDRGLIAAQTADGVYINWRITGQEWFGTAYNIYRDGQKLNATPITGASNYTDPAGSLTSQYQVSAIIDGVEQTLCPAVAVQPNPWIEITLAPIPKIDGVPDSYYESYVTNDITTADLDGDGAYDYIVKRINTAYDPAKPFENQYYSLFEAYRSDGTFMWRIDLGPNIISDVEMNVIAFDFDGDGKAEVVTRTSEGTKDGLGNIIPDLGNAMGQPVPDGKTNYRDRFQQNSSWYEYEGPEYLSLFDGETGEMLDRIDHIARQPVDQWGSSGMSAAQLAHRACKYHYGAPYLDGIHPSLLITRGIYHRIKMATYNIVNKKFVPIWTFDSENGPYSAQGNHNYSIADVDNDGRDEIVYGSMTIDDDGKGLYTTQLGHGDAIHVGDFDPYRKGLEVFACLENSPYYGTTLRTAETGEILLQYIKGSDCGRAIAANFTDRYLGSELAPSALGTFSASERRDLPSLGGSQNFRIYWDGDLLEELVDHNNFTEALGKGVGKVQKYTDSGWKDILVTTGYYSNNYTKGTPCLQADLFGDWREELIYKSDDESKIRIYFTTDSTKYRIYTLMHDMQYRQAIAWQMCGYNQPPHQSYFLGEAEGMTVPPPPVMSNGRVVGQFENGKDLLFDVSSNTGSAISLNSVVSPRNFYVNSPTDYVFDMSAGKLSGTMRFVKQGSGSLTFNGTHDYTGATELWDGLTVFSGQLTASDVEMNRFAELRISGSLGKNVVMDYGSILYIDNSLTVGQDFTAKDGSIIEFDLQSGSYDNIAVGGKLTLGKTVLKIKTTGDLPEGEYILFTAPTFEGDTENIIIEGLESQITSLAFADNKLVLYVKNMRSAAAVVWKGDKAGALWNTAIDENFTLGGSPTYFSVGDAVTFDDSAISKTVNKVGSLQAGSIDVNSSADYVIQGDGKIAGSASLTKSGGGKLTLSGTNDYSGATIVTGGTLAVEQMPYLSYTGSIGAVSSNPELFVLDGGILTTSVFSGTLKSARALKIGSNGGTLNTNINYEWDAVIAGGTLTKTGNGSLTLFGANTYNKTILKSGSIILKTEEANPGKNIVIENGTLTCLDNMNTYSSASWNIEVPEGGNATINLDSRCTYTGTLTGSGILNIKSPYVRSDLNGDWSNFSGTINANSDTDGGDLRFNNNYGLAKAELNLAGKLSVYNNAGTAFAIGALSGGSADTKLIDEAWTVGAKNTNTTFNGIIAGSSLIKTGTGALKLTNANTYSGATTVNGGYLLAMNTTGSATGTGSVSVANTAAIGGKGIIDGNVTIGNSATICSGDPTATTWLDKTGTLTLNKNLTMNGTLRLAVRNGAGYACGKIIVKGNAAFNGNLVLEIADGAEQFPLGVELTLLDLRGTVSGSFSTLSLPATVAGTVWNTDELLTSGKIKVVLMSPINSINDAGNMIYPNPADDLIEIDYASSVFVEIFSLSGVKIMEKTVLPKEKIDVTSLSKGIYLITIKDNGLKINRKLIKK